MRKFTEVFREKQTKAVEVFESKVLTSFEKVYNTLLEKYNVSTVYELNEKYQEVFLKELNNYWSEEKGLSDKGKQFLQQKSDFLNENATVLQKKNFLKKRATIAISETLRQANVKYKIYDVIDEIYEKTNAKSIDDVLSPDFIATIIKESFNEAIDNHVNEIKKELKGSSKNKK